MLVLSRYEDGRITITHNGETLEVVLVEVRSNGKVKLGFEGPKSFAVVRDDAINHGG